MVLGGVTEEEMEEERKKKERKNSKRKKKENEDILKIKICQTLYYELLCVLFNFHISIGKVRLLTF